MGRNLRCCDKGRSPEHFLKQTDRAQQTLTWEDLVKKEYAGNLVPKLVFSSRTGREVTIGNRLFAVEMIQLRDGPIT